MLRRPRHVFLKGLSATQLWFLCFGFAALAAALVQLVILPYVLPAWHAGHGLLVGGDWVEFHRLAVQLSDKIHTSGWAAWELRPEGQAPAGIAGAIYAVTAPEPWVLIPIHAALHATATVVLLKIYGLFSADAQKQLAAVLPFALFPTAALWYTQIHKDGYAILGAFLFLYGWLLLVRDETWAAGAGRVVRTIALIFAGAFCAWVVRPYLVQLFQLVSLVPFLTIMGNRIRTRPATAKRFGIATTAIVCLLVVIGLSPLTRGGVADLPTNAHAFVPWQRTGFLPSFVESKAYTVAVTRNQYRLAFPDAPGNIDTDVSYHNVWDMVAYLPRALEVSFLAPFPDQWFAQGSLASNTLMRRIVGQEMFLVYSALVFLPFSLWRWRSRAESWIILLFSTAMTLSYTMTITNVGSLHRARYGYLMLLVGLGVLGLLEARTSWLSRRKAVSAGM